MKKTKELLCALSAQQVRLLHLLITEMTQAKIGRALGMSEDSIKYQTLVLARMLGLDASNRHVIVARAYELGLIGSSESAAQMTRELVKMDTGHRVTIQKLQAELNQVTASLAETQGKLAAANQLIGILQGIHSRNAAEKQSGSEVLQDLPGVISLYVCDHRRTDPGFEPHMAIEWDDTDEHPQWLIVERPDVRIAAEFADRPYLPSDLRSFRCPQAVPLEWKP